jgi:hypothetical protein
MIYLFNTNIIPCEAVVRVSKITAVEAREIIQGRAFISAIGHEATAQIMGKTLGINCPVNRIHAQPSPHDKAISLKLNGRLPEGAILDEAALSAIGYELYLIEFYDSKYVISPIAEYHMCSQYY